MHRSLSVEHTARDIYKGLKQGRDVVVPGLVNKLYTYLFSQILPSAAVGAITQVQYNTIQYKTIQYNTIEDKTMQYNTMQYNTVQYSAIQDNTIQYNTMQYPSFPLNSIRYMRP